MVWNIYYDTYNSLVVFKTIYKSTAYFKDGNINDNVIVQFNMFKLILHYCTVGAIEEWYTETSLYKDVMPKWKSVTDFFKFCEILIMCYKSAAT